MNLTLPPFSLPARRHLAAAGMIVALAVGLAASLPSYAIDLVAFQGITGPMVAALTQMAALAPGIKALVGFIAFCAAIIGLAALRNFGPVLLFIGVCLFGAVGLVVGGAIMGAVI